MDKQKVDTGKYVAFTYNLYDDADGSVLFSCDAKQPDVMIYGISDDVVPGLAAAIKGLSVGDKFGLTLPPEVAFGHHREEDVLKLDRSIFSPEGELDAAVKVGAELPMMTQQGYMVRGRVLEITPDHVVMDFNHPFAGKTVRYDGEVIEVRDATPEELNPTHGCGCGCGHDCGDGCGDGCGCGDDHDCGCHGDHEHDGCGCH